MPLLQLNQIKTWFNWSRRPMGENTDAKKLKSVLLPAQEELWTKEFGINSVISGKFKIFLSDRRLKRDMLLTVF